jgi:flavin reductase (DIM6/NTAB) family NADH-FMN oxidoreductase RutF
MVSDEVRTCLSDSFRATMARICTPVSVVTTIDEYGPHGTTVSAFSSLSLNPPMVLISLDSRSDLLALVRRTGRFGLNVLGREQSEVALRFARKGRDKFDGVAWRAEHGVARLAANAAWLACEVAEVVAGGDHQIVLGKVLAVDQTDKEPLTYHQRGFGTHLSTAGDPR